MEFNDKQIHLMEAAEQLFAQKGFEGTSVRDIAEAAGVNLAMISYYFGSKEKLMEALFSYRGQTMRLQLQSLLSDESLSPLQKVESLIDSYIDRILQKRHFHQIMVREQMANANASIREQIMQLKKTNQELIRQLIFSGQEKGVFKKDIDVPLLMMTIVGTCSQMVTAQHYYRDMNGLGDVPDAQLQELMRDRLSKYLKQLFKAIVNNEA